MAGDDDDKDGAGEQVFDPDEPRHCTDVICLVIFICLCVAMSILSFYAFHNGNPHKLLYPTDLTGRVCNTGGYGPRIWYPEHVVTSAKGDATKLYGFCVDRCPLADELVDLNKYSGEHPGCQGSYKVFKQQWEKEEEQYERAENEWEGQEMELGVPFEPFDPEKQFANPHDYKKVEKKVKKKEKRNGEVNEKYDPSSISRRHENEIREPGMQGTTLAIHGRRRRRKKHQRSFLNQDGQLSDPTGFKPGVMEINNLDQDFDDDDDKYDSRKRQLVFDQLWPKPPPPPPELSKVTNGCYTTIPTYSQYFECVSDDPR